MILIVNILVLVSLTSSCSIGSTKQVDSKISSSRAQDQVISTPTPLRKSNQNKTERCGPRYYTDISGDEDYSPICYELQLKLVKGAMEGDIEKMKEALQDGANVEGSVYDYFPPLRAAAFQGKTDAVRLLLENGANVNRVAELENTALNGAASQGHTEVIKVLLEWGADPCYKSAIGTAGDIAQAKSQHEAAKLLKASEAIKCR